MTDKQMERLNVGIIGVTGYAGQELLKILLGHPRACVRYLGARQLEKSTLVGELLPSFRDQTLKVHPFRIEEALRTCDLLFLALPHGLAMQMAPRILRNRSKRLIDLSGDFRLRSAREFQRAYQMRHTASVFLREAVYGLPEWNRQQIPQKRLVANPGCYPTAVLLGLAPLAQEGLLKKEGLIVDAKSGVTGAGRSAKEELLFSEVNEDLRAYRVNRHQHIPEIEQGLRELAGHPVRMTFVPHLVPLNRGLYATIYAPLTKPLSAQRLRSIYRKWYGREPLVRLLPQGIWPHLKTVSGTYRCEIGLDVADSGRQAILVSAIDNLGKGAAGQAVQNMNLLCGFPETEGLL